MQWKTADALLEGGQEDDLYVFLREAGLAFGMSVEQVMANTEFRVNEAAWADRDAYYVSR